MDEVEAEHALVVKRERLRWLSATMTGLYARELAEPGSVDDTAVEVLHSSTYSWVTRILALDVPG